MLKILMLLTLIGCFSKNSKGKLDEERSDQFNSIKEILDECLYKYQKTESEVRKLEDQIQVDEIKKEFNLDISNRIELIKNRIREGEKYPFYYYGQEEFPEYISSYFILFLSNDLELIDLCIDKFDEKSRNEFFHSTLKFLNIYKRLYRRKVTSYILGEKCLKIGVTIDPSIVLWEIVDCDNVDLIKILINKYKADINLIKADKDEEKSYNLLQLCIKFQFNNVAECLIENGATLEPRETTYSTIYVAAVNGNVEMFRILLSKGLKPSSSDEEKEILLNRLERQKEIKEEISRLSNGRIELKKEMEEQVKKYKEIINIIKMNDF